MAKGYSRYDGYWNWYEPSRPIRADGLKAKSKRGAFAESWWGRRWIQALTPLMDSGRLSRGRSYARRGQVLNIQIATGQVVAKVQGSRPTPYKVTIELQPLTATQWEAVLDELAMQAIFAAQLLNGEMPDEITQVFDALGAPLFPTARGDLETDCTCPDWANPCKHIAAVYHLLAERFDENPFLLFELRGQSKEQLMRGLQARRAGRLEPEEALYPLYDVEAVAAAPLAESLDAYWGSASATQEIAFRIAPPAVEMALLKRLGIPKFVEARVFRSQLERTYGAITARALEVAFADPE